MKHENISGILKDLADRIGAIGDSLRIEENAARLKELEAKMGQTDFWDNQEAANEVIDELKSIKARIEPTMEAIEKIEEAQLLWDMAEEGDDDETRAEVDSQLDGLAKLGDRLETAALLSGKYDGRNCYLTLQSGAGGTEADDWCEMMMRMYLFYVEKMKWDISEVSKTHGTEAGVKEVTFYIKGPMAYGYLSAERGTHRLARVSPFNAEGKRQTSFVTVDVVPEFPNTKGDLINDQYLDLTTFARSSGPGGQTVNKVASAVRLVYKEPDMASPIMIVCSVERKLEQNKRIAMGMLQGKLELIAEEKREKEKNAATGGSVDRGWGSQIRSYVFYDNRVKDHRTNHEQPNPQNVLGGDLQGFIDSELQRRAREG